MLPERSDHWRWTLVLGTCGLLLAVALGTWFAYEQTPSSKSTIATSAESSATTSAHLAQTGGGGALWVDDKNPDAFDEPGVDGVSLAEAVGSMNRPVSLLSARDVGPVVKVLAGDWGMGVRYGSGITLVVEPRRDLAPEFNKGVAGEADGSVVFSDGKRHEQIEVPPDPSMAASGNVEAFSVNGGTQLLTRGRTWHVRTQLYWNDANFTYSLYSQDDTASLDQLRQYMRDSGSARI